jgi:Flp pilus assembly protein TadD
MDDWAGERFGDGERADVLAETAEQIDRALRHVARGRALMAEGMLEEAERELRLGVMAAPHLADAHFHLGTVYEQEHRVLDALRAYLRTLELEPNHAGALHALAICLRDRWAITAVDLLRRAIEHAPDDADHYRALGEVQRLRGDAAGMERAYQAWLDEHPDDATMLREQAMAYYEMGRTAEAQRCLERAVEVNGEDDEALTHLAALYLELSRWEAAEQLLLRSAALAPWSFMTQGCLAQLYAILGRTDKAFAVLARAVQLEPDEARAMMVREPLLRSLRADPR